MEDMNEAIKKAKECYNCKRAMCVEKGCPIKTNIPEFISKIKKKEFEQAYNILQENNIMSDICSKICPTEEQCMGSCVKGLKSNPVKINELEKFTNKWAKKNNIKHVIKCGKNNNVKIAIIGGGPSGIACAVELAKKGFKTTIFERESELGGVLRYGIPDFRLSKDTISDLSKRLEEIDIEIETNIEFGKDITLENLREKGYKATFLGVGANKSSIYKLHDEENEEARFCAERSIGLHKADEFLRKYNKDEASNLGKLGTVVVIGGGNVAMDAARASVRMGADKVYILYRRDLKAMPASEIELKDALDDGVEIIYQTQVIKSIYENGNMKEIVCLKNRMEDGKPIRIEGSEYNMTANNIIFAIGIFPDKELLEKQGIKFDRALIEVDENQMTNIPGVFAGGDVIESKSSACKAIRMGKTAAENIEKFLKE